MCAVLRCCVKSRLRATRTSEITLSVRISMIRLGHQDITQQSARRNAPEERGGAPLDILGPRQGCSMYLGVLLVCSTGGHLCRGRGATRAYVQAGIFHFFAKLQPVHHAPCSLRCNAVWGWV